jgi:hypothetical protein
MMSMMIMIMIKMTMMMLRRRMRMRMMRGASTCFIAELTVNVPSGPPTV